MGGRSKPKTHECCGGVNNHRTNCWLLQRRLQENVTRKNKNPPELVKRLIAVASGNTLPYGRDWLDMLKKDCGTAADIITRQMKREGHCIKWHMEGPEGEVNERLRFLEEENEYLRGELRKLRGEAHGSPEGT